MEKFFLGSVFGSNLSWKRTEQGLEIRPGYYESVGGPILIVIFGLVFFISSYEDSDKIGFYFFLLTILSSVYLYIFGFRRIVLSAKEVELRFGHRVRKRILASPMVIKKITAEDRISDGPRFHTAYILSIGDERLLATHSLKLISNLQVEIQKMGYEVRFSNPPSP